MHILPSLYFFPFFFLHVVLPLLVFASFSLSEVAGGSREHLLSSSSLLLDALRMLCLDLSLRVLVLSPRSLCSSLALCLSFASTFSFCFFFFCIIAADVTHRTQKCIKANKRKHKWISSASLCVCFLVGVLEMRGTVAGWGERECWMLFSPLILMLFISLF